MSKYEIEIYRLNVSSNNFTRIDSIQTFTNLQYNPRLNDVGRATFTLSIYDTKATNANLVRFRNHVRILRYGVEVFFGPIVQIYRNYDVSSQTIQINCESMLSHFEARYTDKFKQYIDIAQSQIAWDLINQSQLRTNGSLGIISGSLPSGTNRDRTYEFGKVAELLRNLSNVIGGIDFTFNSNADSNNILTNVSFNVFNTKIGFLRTDLNTIEIGKNVYSMTLRSNNDIYNSITSEGAGSGDVIQETYELTGSQLGYTRREDLFFQKSVSVEQTLADNLNAYGNSVSTENVIIQVDLYENTYPIFGSYNLGDTLNINLNIEGSDYLNKIVQGRIDSYTVIVSENETDYISLQFETYV